MCTPTKRKTVEEIFGEKEKVRREDLHHGPKHSTFRKQINVDAVRRHLIFQDTSSDDDSDIADPVVVPMQKKRTSNSAKRESNDSGLFLTPESCRSLAFPASAVSHYRYRQLSPADTSEDSDSSLIELPKTPVIQKRDRCRPRKVMNKALADMGIHSVVEKQKNNVSRITKASKRKQNLCNDEPENKVVATPNRRGRNKPTQEDVSMPSPTKRTPTRRLTARRRGDPPVQPSLSQKIQEDFPLNVVYQNSLEACSNIISDDDQILHVKKNYECSKYWVEQLGYPSSCDDDSVVMDLSSVGEDHMEALCL